MAGPTDFPFHTGLKRDLPGLEGDIQGWESNPYPQGGETIMLLHVVCSKDLSTEGVR